MEQPQNKSFVKYLSLFIVSSLILILTVGSSAFLIYQKFFRHPTLNPNTTQNQISQTPTQTITPTGTLAKKEIRLESNLNPDYVKLFSMTYPQNYDLKAEILPDGKNNKMVVTYNQAELTIQSILRNDYSQLLAVGGGTNPYPDWNNFFLTKSDENFNYYSFGNKVTWEDTKCKKVANICFYDQISVSLAPVFKWKASIKAPKNLSQSTLNLFYKMVTEASELVRINASYKGINITSLNISGEKEEPDTYIFTIPISVEDLPADFDVDYSEMFNEFRIKTDQFPNFPDPKNLIKGKKYTIEGKVDYMYQGVGEATDILKFYDLIRIN